MKKHLLRAAALLTFLATLAACGSNVNVLEVTTTTQQTTTAPNENGVTVHYTTTNIPTTPTRAPTAEAPLAPGQGTTAPQHTFAPGTTNPNLTYPNQGAMAVTSIQILGIDRVGTSAPFQIQLGAIRTPDEQPQRQLVVQTNPPHARWRTDFTVTSSNPSVIQAPWNGLLRALAPGTATITVRSVTNPNVSASIVVTVLPPV